MLIDKSVTLVKLICMKTIIGIKQFHKDMSRIARRVKRGERVLVMKHAEPLFILAPYTDDEALTHRVHTPKYRLEDLQRLKAKGGNRTISRDIDKIVYDL